MEKKEKNIVIGICGSIAAYKVPGLIRQLKGLGWGMRFIMTKEAEQFITRLTIETVGQSPVYTDMFEREHAWEISHVSLGESGRFLLVIPATANIIGKAANGIADDLLSATIMAFAGTVIFAPAMNFRMWESPIVQENVKKLKQNGFLFVGPVEGKLADGSSGIGRMAEIEDIIKFLEKEAGKNG